MPDHLDHIVFAAPDLCQAVERFVELTGVRPATGGQHVGLGTANHLVGLGGEAYLEIIGPDPAQPAPPQPRRFGIDRLTEARVMAWAIHPPDLDARIEAARAAGHDPGEVFPMSRRTPDGETMRWRLTWPDLDATQGLVPFLIDWGDTPPPPGRGLPMVPLVSLEATHPAPDRLRPALAALGVDLPLRPGNRAGLTVVLAGRHGEVVLT
ncbi:MAG: VOC family protein [Pseudonocardia sp.]|nr:VOC family protein [Pseudonocardia sp.]